jgi:hypothetical protein
VQRPDKAIGVRGSTGVAKVDRAAAADKAARGLAVDNTGFSERHGPKEKQLRPLAAVVDGPVDAALKQDLACTLALSGIPLA